MNYAFVISSFPLTGPNSTVSHRLTCLVTEPGTHFASQAKRFNAVANNWTSSLRTNRFRFSMSASGDSSKTTLYLSKRSRGTMVLWYIEELGLDVNYHWLERGDNKLESYLKVNPFGKIPAISETTEDGVMWSLFESGAILTYLAAKYDPTYPRDDLRKQAEINSWILWANSTLQIQMFTPQGQPRLAELLGPVEEHCKKLEDHIKAGKPGFWLGGDKLSVVDIVMSTCINYIPLFVSSVVNIPEQFPYIAKYLARMDARPLKAKARY